MKTLDNGLVDLATEVIDEFVDKNSDILSAFPGVGNVVAFVRAKNSITDRIFLAKITKFLQETGKIPHDVRKKFFEKHAQDPHGIQKISDTLILAIDAIDDLEKAERISWAFEEYMRDKIDGDLLRRIVRSLTLAYIGDVKAFESYHPNRQIIERLIGTGFAEQLIDKGRDRIDFGVKETDVGLEYRKIAIDRLGLRPGPSLSFVTRHIMSM